MDELEEIVAQLRERGLFAGVSNGPPPQVIGGKSVSGGSKIPIYGNSFSILREAGGWMVRTEGRGQVVNEAVVATSAEVIQLIVTQTD